ncbi:MAG: hypothetical protein AAGA77_14280 [Bacteroidota bacterium]
MEKQQYIKDTLNIMGQIATQLDFLSETWKTLYANQELMKPLTLGGYYSPQTFVESTSGMIQNLIIIKANAFLDEFNQEFNITKYPEHKQQILNIKKWCKPIMNQIKKWSGIKSYRNEILGHNHRKRGFSLFNTMSEYKIPYSHYDYVALCELIFMIANQLKYEFEEIMKECLSLKLSDKYKVPKQNSISPSQVDKIRMEVEKLRCAT